MKKIANFLLLMLIVAAGSGCANVQPWERGNLARPDMAPDPFPAQSISRSHTYGSREAMRPAGGGGAGGGCGCY